MIKRLLFSLLIGLLLTNCTSKQKEEVKTGIIFREDADFAQALKQSKSEGKLLFIDCYAVWCGPCKRLSKEIFPQKELGELYNAKFICLKYDMEKPIGAEIKAKFNVNGYPTLLFVNAKGEVIQKRIGDGTVKDFMNLAELALDSTKSINQISAMIANGDRTLSVVSNYLSANPYASNIDTLLNDYYTSLNLSTIPSKETLDLFMSFDANLNSLLFQYILKNRYQIEQIVGKKEFKEKLLDAFYNFQEVNRGNPSKLDTLKIIDIEVYNKLKLKDEYEHALTSFNEDLNNKEKWNDLTKTANLYLSQSDIGSKTLNKAAREIWSNYKTFNDTTALRTSLEWAKRAHEARPNNPEMADTYGHILFDLGFIKEAVEMAETSVTEGERTSSKDLKNYKDNVVNYKKSLK